MSRQAISLIEALSEMNDKTRPFQIKFVRYDQSRKQGGEVIELTNAITCGSAANLNNQDMISVRQLGNDNHPYPVRIHLITEFNNQKVHY